MPHVDIRHGSYDDVLDDVEADLILTSPPYNVGSRAARDDGQRRHGRYDRKSFGAIRDYPDDLPEPDYQDSQARFLVWAAHHLAYGGVLVYNHKPRRKGKRLIHPGEWFLRPEVTADLTLMEEIIWDRGSTHNHCPNLMWPHTERLYVFKRAGDPYKLRNTANMTQRSDVWRLPLTTNNGGHNAPFTVALAKAAIETWSNPGDLICDPYMGSGTTAVAAIELGRRVVGAEILDKYFVMAKGRAA